MSLFRVLLLFICLQLPFGFTAAATQSPQELIQICTQNLGEKIETSVRRIENFCKEGVKKKVNIVNYQSCILEIHLETKTPAEIVQPYCLQKNTLAYRLCVIDNLKNQSPENPFKKCL